MTVAAATTTATVVATATAAAVAAYDDDVVRGDEGHKLLPWRDTKVTLFFQ